MTQSKFDVDTYTSRMEQATAKKTAGNSFFQSGEWRKASFNYKLVYLYLSDYLPAEASPIVRENDAMTNMLSKKARVPLEFELRAADLFVTTLSNLSLAHLKLNRPADAMASCDQAMQIISKINAKLEDEAQKKLQKSNEAETGAAKVSTGEFCKSTVPKLRFRKACAMQQLGMLENARTELLALSSENPSDQAVVQKLRENDELASQANVKDKKVFANMFAALAKD